MTETVIQEGFDSDRDRPGLPVNADPTPVSTPIVAAPATTPAPIAIIVARIMAPIAPAIITSGIIPVMAVMVVMMMAVIPTAVMPMPVAPTPGLGGIRRPQHRQSRNCGGNQDEIPHRDLLFFFSRLNRRRSLMLLTHLGRLGRRVLLFRACVSHAWCLTVEFPQKLT